MNECTQDVLDAMMEMARAGQDVYPFMFQPLMGRSNSVSAAIRHALKQGLLVKAGLDGTGRPFYRAPQPEPTHAAPASIN